MLAFDFSFAINGVPYVGGYTYKLDNALSEQRPLGRRIAVVLTQYNKFSD